MLTATMFTTQCLQVQATCVRKHGFQEIETLFGCGDSYIDNVGVLARNLTSARIRLDCSIPRSFSVPFSLNSDSNPGFPLTHPPRKPEQYSAPRTSPFPKTPPANLGRSSDVQETERKKSKRLDEWVFALKHTAS